MTISGELLRLVEVRANYQCEYCQRPLRDEIGEVDHIVPTSAGGSSDPSNLALSCARCNRNKGNQTSALDPDLWVNVPIFNPRAETWGSHFKFYQPDPIGITAMGRATAYLLFRSTPQHYPQDLGWHWAQTVHDASLYNFLNRHRALRLSNQFESVEKARLTEDMMSRAQNEDRRSAVFALEMLKIEVCLTRCTSQDIATGLRVIRDLGRMIPLEIEERRQLLGMRATLLGQLATILALDGDPRVAQEIQERATTLWISTHSGSLGTPSLERIRRLTLVHKHAHGPIIEYSAEDLSIALDLAKEGNLGPLTFLADAELCSSRPTKLLDRLVSDVTGVIETSGYGQSFDYARPIPLRRRWWGLSLLAREEIDSAQLESDLRFWRRIRMDNERRALQLNLVRIASSLPASARGDLLQLVADSPR